MSTDQSIQDIAEAPLNANVTLKSEYKRVESTRNYNGSFVPAYNAAEPTFDGDIFSIGADFVF